MEKLTVVNENERLSKEEIEKMIEDADKYKQEDQEYKKKADVFNALEDCIYNMKKMEHVIVDATTWIEDNQDAIVDEIERMKEQLESMCMPKF
ncbi:heat shock 70 kDa protein 4 [Lactuca sativa]|nr:heat shock 70 kDa protein 4 [Lactuca sativa]